MPASQGLRRTMVYFLVFMLQMDEFREKMKSTMQIGPKKESTGKSDFKTVRELVNYLLDEDRKSKKS